MFCRETADSGIEQWGFTFLDTPPRQASPSGNTDTNTAPLPGYDHVMPLLCSKADGDGALTPGCHGRKPVVETQEVHSLKVQRVTGTDARRAFLGLQTARRANSNGASCGTEASHLE